MGAKMILSNQVQKGHWGYYGDDENGWEVVGVEREALQIARVADGAGELKQISWSEAADQNWLWWTER